MSVILCVRQSKIRHADRKNGEHESAEAVLCARAEKRELRVVLFTVGLIVFALCDINVLLYNLPDYIDIRSHFILSLLDFAGNAMWAFYLPSQVMIAVSPKQ